ncbi:hypothetical protein EIN_373980, partial [Entamoeba invadens IP1]
MNTRHLQLQLEYITIFGEDLFVRLNNTYDLPMIWNNGHIWKSTVMCDTDRLTYQYVVKYRGQMKRIEECNWRVVSLPSDAEFGEKWAYPMS